MWHTPVIDKYINYEFVGELLNALMIQHGFHQDKYVSLGLLLRGLKIHSIWRGSMFNPSLGPPLGHLNLLLSAYADNLQECVAGCVRKGDSYFWCYNTLGGWDYCSPSDKKAPKSSDDVTIYNEKCLTACDTYGKSYFWCW